MRGAAGGRAIESTPRTRRTSAAAAGQAFVSVLQQPHADARGKWRRRQRIEAQQCADCLFTTAILGFVFCSGIKVKLNEVASCVFGPLADLCKSAR